MVIRIDRELENILLTILILIQVVNAIQLYQLKKNSNPDTSLIQDLLQNAKDRIDRLLEDVERLEKK